MHARIHAITHPLSLFHVQTIYYMEFSFQSNHLLSLNSTIPSADELFLNGTILPLKLPPCLQIITNMDTNTCSRKIRSRRRRGRSPMSPTFLSSSFRCDKNKDLDPFMLALEVVRKEANESPKGRRARSLSPLRTSSFWGGSNDNNDDDDERMGSCKVGRRKLRFKEWRFRREGDHHDAINGSRYCKRSSSGVVMEELRKKSVKLCGRLIFICFGFKP